MSKHLENLKRHQRWRRGAEDIEQLKPVDVGLAIDYAIAVCEAAENLVKVKGRHHTEQAYKKLEEALK